MLITNTDYIVGKEITEMMGIVRGHTIRAKHLGNDIVSGLRNLVGGEMKEYSKMLEEARDIAMNKMLDEANQMNADAIINIRFSTSAVMQGAAEILVYGTAVKLKDKE
ncbi:MAG: YbjQ family protein [Firmicutes bacterium]|nr:YbjQ family protein [Bacillota bacterium]